MPTSSIAAQRDEVQQDLWTRTAAVAGRLNRAHADLVDIAAELIEDEHWGDGGFRSPSATSPSARACPPLTPAMLSWWHDAGPSSRMPLRP